jgi:hypothetical protein
MNDDRLKTVQAELAATIADAWRVFGRYEFKRPLEVCRCDVCVQPDEEALLLRTPVADMSAPLMQVYTESAHSSSPYADEQFRALLPRYFELMAYGAWPSHSTEITLSRLGGTAWRTSWNLDEVAIIERYFSSLFGYALQIWSGPLGETQPSDLLCMVALADGDVEPLLRVWDEDVTLSGALKLADLIADVSWGRRKNPLGAFWDVIPEREERVIGWLRRPESREKLTAAFFLTEDADQQQRLSNAELVL